MKRKLKPNIKNLIQVIALFVLIFCCFFYLKTKVTYTSYESEIEGNINPNIAKWSIKINDESVSDLKDDLEVAIDDIVWNCGTVRDGKVAPGCSGVMNLTIDANNTDVAVLYELEVIDKNVDEDKILKVTNIALDNSRFIRTDINKYAGVFSLDDIKNNATANMVIDVFWDDTIDIEYDEELLGNLDSYLVINFSAKQYAGEVIVPYTE